MIRRWFSRNPDRKGLDIEGLRTEFKARYHAFKLLLNANNRALEIMSEMEEALKGARPFGMNFVSSRCTAVSTDVWQMVRQLNELSTGKYEPLYDRFKEIRKRINPFVENKGLIRSHPGSSDVNRRGRARRFFQVEGTGKQVLKQTLDSLDRMRSGLM